MNLKVILFGIISCLAVIFIIQNVAAVTVNIFFWQVSLSIALLIFIILAAGFAAGWFWRRNASPGDQHHGTHPTHPTPRGVSGRSGDQDDAAGKVGAGFEAGAR